MRPDSGAGADDGPRDARRTRTLWLVAVLVVVAAVAAFARVPLGDPRVYLLLLLPVVLLLAAFALQSRALGLVALVTALAVLAAPFVLGSLLEAESTHAMARVAPVVVVLLALVAVLARRRA